MLFVLNLTRLVGLRSNVIIQRFSSSTASNLLNSMKQHLKIEHDSKKQKFFMNLEHDDVAVLKYESLSNNEVLLYNTEVPSKYNGKGLGRLLALEAFKHFEDNGQKMVITCPFLQKVDQQRRSN